MRRVEGDSEARRGFHRVHDVEVMRPRFRPVLPWMRACVGADMPVLPARRWPLLVVTLEGGIVIHGFIAEELAEPVQPRSPGDELIPKVMGDLVAQMPEQCAVGLAKMNPPAFALLVIGFSNVDGDRALTVAGQRQRSG